MDMSDLTHQKHLQRARVEDYEFLRANGLDHVAAAIRVGVDPATFEKWYSREGRPMPGARRAG